MCRVISLALPIILLIVLIRWITQKQTEREIYNFKIKMETIPVVQSDENDYVEDQPMIVAGLPRVRVDRSVESNFDLCSLIESVNYTNDLTIFLFL